MLSRRLKGTQNLGHTTKIHAGMAIGSVDSSPGGLSWLVESQVWEPRYETHRGGLAMDPVTFQRLVNFLTTHSHTGMGSATNALARDVDGINSLVREATYDQSLDEVIGPRHPLFNLEGY
jgi:hypothetical protein